MNKRTLIAGMLMCLCCIVAAQEVDGVPRGNMLKRFFYEFNYIDTSYVEPNHYNWTVMMQNTNNFEWLNLSTPRSSTLSMSPDPLVKIGPYLGWRWIFLGYTFSVNNTAHQHITRKEFEMSLYGSMLGIDLIFRDTGDDFRWRQLFSDSSPSLPLGEYSGGVSLQTFGINSYYIFNHRRFSYPSLFSQSTVQKRSCGSFIAGLSVTRHKYNFDMQSWPDEAGISPDGSSNMYLKYMNYAVSLGYSYNWVLRKNLMLGISLTPAIGYKKITSSSDIDSSLEYDTFKEWWDNNINVDFTGRAALVWNNNKRFAGMSIILHNYNFSHNKLAIHNTFGTVNFYVGLNFIRRGQKNSR